MKLYKRLDDLCKKEIKFNETKFNEIKTTLYSNIYIKVDRKAFLSTSERNEETIRII